MQKSNLISRVSVKAPCITVLKSVEKSDENKHPTSIASKLWLDLRHASRGERLNFSRYGAQKVSFSAVER